MVVLMVVEMVVDMIVGVDGDVCRTAGAQMGGAPVRQLAVSCFHVHKLPS